jgi:hypothetical protein
VPENHSWYGASVLEATKSSDPAPPTQKAVTKDSYMPADAHPFLGQELVALEINEDA